MRMLGVAAIVLCACATSFGVVSYDGGTFTITYGAPSDLDSAIDPAGLNNVQVAPGMTVAQFQALNPQVVGFNNAPASFSSPTQTLVVQHSLANTVTFNFAAKYNYGGATSFDRGAFSGVNPNDDISAVETLPGNCWFDVPSIVGTGGQGVAALGFCAAFRSDVTNAAGQAIFTLSDSSTAIIDIPMIGGSIDNHTLFVGYQAPAGLTITAVQCTRNGGGNSYPGIDDLSFVMTPEPMTLTLLALGGLMVARRRHA
jgi:hypothetical protein